MAFNSFSYIFLFLPVVAIGYNILRSRARHPWPQAWLLAASLVFYAQGKTSNLPLLGGSILLNWALARLMTQQTDPGRRKRVLFVGLAANITLLFLFKYINLFLDTIASFHGPKLHFPDWGFPLGVSFFTLTQIMYLVDAYPRPPSSPAGRKFFRGLLGPNSLFDHATFVTLFPYVVSGPLVKARPTVPQLRKYILSEDRELLACRGLYLFSLGLVKKVVLADSFAPLADAGFASIGNFSTLEAWVFCLSALLHLYFDFSGYSDMAVGSAWMMGIDIPQNFNAPLRARSISEFWQRWHISLSNFITDYLYTPLLRAFGRPTLATSAVATILAMMIAALWHGPAWTFVAWGVSHGVALATHQIWKKRKLSMPDWLGWAVTMLFLVATIAFLRAPDLNVAGSMFQRLLPHAHPFGLEGLRKIMLISPTLIVRPVGIGIVVAILFRSSMQMAESFRPSWRTCAATASMLLLALIYINSAPARPFIYFAF